MCLTLIKGIFPEHLKYTCMQILWMLHGYPVFDCSPIFSNALHVLSFSRTSVTFTSISSGGMVVLFRNAKSCFKKDENSIKPLQCTWWCVNCIICHTNNNVEIQKERTAGVAIQHQPQAVQTHDSTNQITIIRRIINYC